MAVMSTLQVNVIANIEGFKKGLKDADEFMRKRRRRPGGGIAGGAAAAAGGMMGRTGRGFAGGAGTVLAGAGGMAMGGGLLMGGLVAAGGLLALLAMIAKMMLEMKRRGDDLRRSGERTSKVLGGFNEKMSTSETKLQALEAELSVLGETLTLTAKAGEVAAKQELVDAARRSFVQRGFAQRRVTGGFMRTGMPFEATDANTAAGVRLMFQMQKEYMIRRNQIRNRQAWFNSLQDQQPDPWAFVRMQASLGVQQDPSVVARGLREGRLQEHVGDENVRSIGRGIVEGMQEAGGGRETLDQLDF